MSKQNFSLKYREAQIIKHALQHYIKRDGANSKDVDREKILLGRVEKIIDVFKCMDSFKEE